MHFTPIIKTLMYLICGAAYAAVGWSRRRGSHQRRRQLGSKWFWFGMGAALVILGVFRMFNAQLNIADVGRQGARAEGLYGERRDMQLAAVLILLAIGVACTASLRRRHRYSQIDFSRWFPIAGLVWLATLAGIYALSYHYADRVLGGRLLGPITIGGMFEGAVLLAMMIYAARRLAGSRRRSSHVSLDSHTARSARA